MSKNTALLIDTGYVSVDGVKLYYETAGAGRPLILVHGNGESHEIFSKAVPELAKSYRVYTPDSRCHGKSEWTETISYQEMAGDLISLIRILDLQKPIFYGFSDGGILGLLIAMKEPTLLGKLIISGANLRPSGLKLWTRLEILTEAIRGNPLSRLMLREPQIDPEDLNKIRVPTVILAGERDVIRRSHTEKIAAHIQGSVLEILPGEDHGSYIIGSQKFAPILKRLIS